MYPNSRIEFTWNNIQVNVSDSLDLLCTVDGLQMVGVHCKLHSKQNLTKLWFGSTDDLIMSNDDGFNSIFSINRSGQFTLTNEFAPVPLWQDLKRCQCGIPKHKKTRYFAVNDGGTGSVYCVF